MAERGSLDQLPASTLGQYKVRARLGSGGMGDVYDAVHTTLDKRVAIKTLRRRYLEDEIVVARFLREGQLASRMRHPNIVDITDVGVIDGLPCLVMEHLEGETLSQVIRRDGAMTPAALVDILLPIVAAVDFAHDHGVLHRDLKPSNIFLARSWNGETHAKVLDFGISKLVHESQEAALTTDSAFVGTPHYASPESVRAEKSDRRADLYSMGVILYEGLVGARPFKEKGGTFVAMAMAICNGDYPPLRSAKPEISEALERVVQKAMALRAEDRYPTMRQLGEALLPFASDRARVIWAPTFKADGPDAPSSQPDNTQVLAPSGGMTAVLPSSRAMPSGMPVNPSTGGWPSSSVQALSSSSLGRSGSHGGQSGGQSGGHASSGGHPSMGPQSNGRFASIGPQPISMSSSSSNAAIYHSANMQVPMHDRTPSFGNGMGTSFQMAAPKKSSAGLVAIIGILALVGIGAVGLVVARTSKASAAGDPTAAGADAALFTVDVRTNPDTAVIEVDGAAVGTGHFLKQLPKDGRQHVLRVSANGHETVLVQFDDSHLPPNVVALRPIGQPSSASAGGSAAAPTSTLAGPKGPSVIAPTPNGGGNRPIAGPQPQAPGPAGKGKPSERPRTDNIDPWE